MLYFIYDSYHITEGGKNSMQETVIYNRLPVLRAERGMSRQDLAKALGINYQTIGYLERGEYNPSIELAFRISDFFGLPIEAIFSRKPFRPLSEEVYQQNRS
jgi:putative transcriptional regulator